MVSKACISGAYQTKLEAIAAYDDVALPIGRHQTISQPSVVVSLLMT